MIMELTHVFHVWLIIANYVLNLKRFSLIVRIIVFVILVLLTLIMVKIIVSVVKIVKFVLILQIDA